MFIMQEQQKYGDNKLIYMSKIHYFQRYTQRENVVTNNTMLLFSRLYHYSPLKFKKFLDTLLEFDIEVGVNFTQQEKNSNSTPDGVITQESFKIAIETKLHNGFGIKQLENHLTSFKDENKSVLIALSNIPMDSGQLKDVRLRVSNFNDENKKNILLISTTFQQIISIFREELSDYDIELNDIIDDYEEFCNNTGLLPKDYPRMLIVPCGSTIKDNIEFKLYYDPAHRSFSRATHIGIYNNKAVKAIGRISNVVTADYDEEKEELKIIHQDTETSQDQKERIRLIILRAKETLGWSIAKGHKFFCFEDMEITNYRKISSGGIMGKRYENLELKTGLGKNATTIEFAEALNNLIWT